ncbi:MAG: flagellar filament capping protein FliD [Enterobacteriaceae bacterium]
MIDPFNGLSPAEVAQNFALMNVSAMKQQWETQKKTVSAQQDGLKRLTTAITDFRNVVRDLNKVNNGVLKTKASVSKEGYADITTDSSARKGTYNLFVESLASAHQVAFTDMTDDDVKNATGELTLKMGDKDIVVNMDDMESLEDLQKAINGHEDNPGITASLTRINGEPSLRISSDKSGAANEIKIDFADANLAAKKQVTISKAADAVVWEGKPGEGVKHVRSTNTFDDLIKGVKLELTQAQKITYDADGKVVSADDPLVITVGTDDSATKEELNKFIDGYNKLKDQLNELTAVGGGSDKKKRGVFAGDSAITALERQLNSALRGSYGGAMLSQLGITADKQGKLTLDSEKLDKAMKEDPGVLGKVFNGNDGLLKSIDKTVDRYVGVNGSLKQRQDSLDRRDKQLEEKSKTIQMRYDASYKRYLNEFGRLQQAMSQMQNSMGIF